MFPNSCWWQLSWHISEDSVDWWSLTLLWYAGFLTQGVATIFTMPLWQTGYIWPSIIPASITIWLLSVLMIEWHRELFSSAIKSLIYPTSIHVLAPHGTETMIPFICKFSGISAWHDGEQLLQGSYSLAFILYFTSGPVRPCSFTIPLCWCCCNQNWFMERWQSACADSRRTIILPWELQSKLLVDGGRNNGGKEQC